jgi:hypothetical protein
MRKISVGQRRARGRTVSHPTHLREHGAVAGFAADSSSSSDGVDGDMTATRRRTQTSATSAEGAVGDKGRNEEPRQQRKRACTGKSRVFLPTDSGDPFLQELKIQQQSRLENPSCGLETIDVTKAGSRDQGDPSTTNIFIGQLVRT